MNTLNRIADWLYSLNPYQLTCVTVALLSAVIGLCVVVAFFRLAALSGAGEGHPEEADEAKEREAKLTKEYGPLK